jgi:hypothetical protein
MSLQFVENSDSLEVQLLGFNTIIESLSGTLTRTEAGAYKGELETVYRAAPKRKWELRTTVTVVDAQTLKMRIDQVPYWASTGKMLGRKTQEGVLKRGHAF